MRCALPGRLAIPLFDTSKRSSEHTYWNLRRSRTDERKSRRLTASPSPLKPAISRVHRIVIWQWGGISVSLSSPSSGLAEFDLQMRWEEEKTTFTFHSNFSCFQTSAYCTITVTHDKWKLNHIANSKFFAQAKNAVTKESKNPDFATNCKIWMYDLLSFRNQI